MKNQLNQNVIQYAIDQLKDGVGLYCHYSDLHHEIFNTDYFMIGYYECEQWIKTNVGVFKAIRDIQEYEIAMFGETNTDVSDSEKVCNMWVYIEGEKILGEIKHLQKFYGSQILENDVENIIAELENL